MFSGNRAARLDVFDAHACEVIVALCDMWGRERETFQFFVVQDVKLLPLFIADLHALEHVAALSEDSFKRRPEHTVWELETPRAEIARKREQ